LPALPVYLGADGKLATMGSSSTPTAPGQGITLTVGCAGGTPGQYSTLNAALQALPLNGLPNTILVSGTCNESVSIGSSGQDPSATPPQPLAVPYNVDRLSIRGNPSATITASSGAAMNILRTTNIQLENLSFVTTDPNAGAVGCGDFSICYFNNVYAQSPPSPPAGGAAAISISSYSQAYLYNVNASNSYAGLGCYTHCVIRLYGTDTFSGNTTSGVSLAKDASVIFATDAVTISGNDVGIDGGSGGDRAYFQNGGTLTVTRNRIGVTETQGSYFRLLGASITSNSWYGVVVGAGATLDVTGVAAAGNGSALQQGGGGDIWCAATALVLGMGSPLVLQPNATCQTDTSGPAPQ